MANASAAILAREDRYSRQMAVPSFGEHGQRALAAASVGVVGAGGVKSPILLYLAAAGVGRIRVVDFDRVELSNLNRQILYTVEDIGRYKAEAAAARLAALNSDIRIEAVVDKVGAVNFVDLLGDCDVVLEGGDSGAGRKEFNLAALAHGTVYVHASAQYNYSYVFTVVPTLSACFECVFDDLPDSQGGAVPVMGPATGVAGSVAAAETISILAGPGATLTTRMFFHDGSSQWSGYLDLDRRAGCPACAAARPPSR